MAYLLLLIGFILLIKGADYFVEGASGIAKLLRVPPILIGLTIVAFGTSSPEAAVSIRAAVNGNNGIALGNVVGSNVFNISLIIGITAMLNPLQVERETVRKEIPFTLLASILLLVLVSDTLLQGLAINQITMGDGLVLGCFFLIFMFYLLEVALHSRERDEEMTAFCPKTMGKNVLFTAGGLAAIISGGELVVRSSTTIAKTLGMSETMIGLTIVAVGTSLPELITSVTAAVKKQSEIAVGNIVGSNIFNILFVLGISSAIHPIRVDPKIFFDIRLMILYTAILLIFSRTHHKISRKEGFVLLLSYLFYAVHVILRG
ncbi:cation:H+ antiporter [Geosporobacter subterraneus DSM 17957]|uniref:Cation:H+ antiporter n=1 Tax=Geosporobacter subterraneus DSM 17957 TaxID=1121919 RepID=A0A1M6KD37_9FIRM|nr:calcium/sodium antiporter [Geosporobacter subterraneus]SHJ56767.1 cation:H+ antiporter [Geosporobacter subterraneus DSM 17957]